MSAEHAILITDDDTSNREALREDLLGAGYANIITAPDGKAALDILTHGGHQFDLILLDRMMPNMGGIDLLKHLKSNPEWSDIPVIMQTSASGQTEIAEGINAGAYYYLTKPYKPETMLSIVRAALDDSRRLHELLEKTRHYAHTLGLFREASIELSTLEEAQNVAALLANCYPDPEAVVLGIAELLINAVEHGNLGLGYLEKGRLLGEGSWEQEIARRQALPENRHKKVYLRYERTNTTLTLHIQDQGQGFDWKPYFDISTSRATHSHGRGIALTRLISFHELEYLGIGNAVMCRVNLAAEV